MILCWALYACTTKSKENRRHLKPLSTIKGVGEKYVCVFIASSLGDLLILPSANKWNRGVPGEWQVPLITGRIPVHFQVVIFHLNFAHFTCVKKYKCFEICECKYWNCRASIESLLTVLRCILYMGGLYKGFTFVMSVCNTKQFVVNSHFSSVKQ